MKKEEILKMYSSASYAEICDSPELLPGWYITSPSSIRITGYLGDDGLFYFVEVVGILRVRDWGEFFESPESVVSIDYGYTREGIRFALIGLRVPPREKIFEV